MQKIQREYKGIVETLSDIGGIKELIHMVFAGIYLLFHSKFEKEYLVEHIYNSKKKRKSKSNCCKKKKEDKTHKEAAKVDEDKSQSVRIDKDGVFEVSDEVFDQAADSVEKTLDVVTIAKELNCLRHLVAFLLRDYQRQLSPLIVLSQDLSVARKLKSVNSEIKTSKSGSGNAVQQAVLFAASQTGEVMDPATAF